MWARPRIPAPSTRPIEDLAVLVRRLGRRVHHPEPGLRFAKLEGLRRAYDHVLSECCVALGVEHLLDVIEPGPELDAERARVEWALYCTGFDLELP